MTRAAELIIQALLPRRTPPVLERQTGMPYGWGLWLRNTRERLGVLSREKSETIVADLVARPAPPRGAVAPQLPFWRALRSLFYQQWDPPLREERGMRWLASAISVLMHLLFVLLLIWVAVVRLPPLPPEAGEGSRVQVEIIGRGTPQEEGGGAPSEAESAAAAASGSAPASAPSQATAATDSPVTPRAMPEFVPPSPTLATEVPQVREREITEPAPEAPQPVQVTETPVPQIEYALPPPNLRREAITAPTITPRETAVQEREVTVVQTPDAPRITRERPITTPQIQRDVQQVQEREIAAPLPQVRTAEVPSRIAPARDLTAPSVAVREREISAPQPAATSGNATAPATPSTTTGAASGANAARPATGTSTGTARTNTPPGMQPGANSSGPARTDRTGGWATPTRGDDWGASNRNVAGDSGANAGKTPGLFNADGSVRAPGQSGGDTTADRGAPGGDSDDWTRERIDRSGTWLQRPPNDYEPTKFDKYWVPNESLLAEWVRRNIRETTISIPGTNKKLRCVISVLQLGGGCGISDPNLNEQPASARPPPDIPVKRTPVPTDS